MTLEQIKSAITAGKTVHWCNPGYTVIHDTSNGCDQWLIAWNRGGHNANYIGLTWQDGKTMNCNHPDEFYIAEKED